MSQFYGNSVEFIPAYCGAEDCEAAADLILQFFADVEELGYQEVNNCRDWADSIMEQSRAVIDILKQIPNMKELVDWALDLLSDEEFHATYREEIIDDQLAGIY